MKKIVKYITDNTLIEEVVEAEVPQEIMEELPFGQVSTSSQPFAEDTELMALERAIAQYLPIENSLTAFQQNRLQELRTTYANRRDFLVRQVRTELARREGAVHSSRRRGVNINVVDDTVPQGETVSEDIPSSSTPFTIDNLEVPNNLEPIAHVENDEEYARRIVEEQGLRPDVPTVSEYEARARTGDGFWSNNERSFNMRVDSAGIHAHQGVEEQIGQDRPIPIIVSNEADAEAHEADSTFVSVEENAATYGFVDDESQILPYARPDNE
ncbi:MAG: hypothetical protein ACTSQF_00300 [Candidatus Heimdallarchaeaceae archaeon]